MDEQLKEIEGTLARTKERKNTILYKFAKKKEQEQRLAKLHLRELPTVPSEVTDEKIVKYVLFNLSQQIGEKKTLIKDNTKTSLQKDGEAFVRSLNNEINRLIRRKCDWERRLADLTGKDVPISKAAAKHFFGCAKELPEASNKQPKKIIKSDVDNALISNSSRSSFSSDTSDDAASTGSDALWEGDREYYTLLDHLVSSSVDQALLKEEKLSEKNERCSTDGIASKKSEAILLVDIENLPDEEHFKGLLVKKRKESLLHRLKAMQK